jgi:hypothetical protein
MRAALAVVLVLGVLAGACDTSSEPTLPPGVTTTTTRPPPEPPPTPEQVQDVDECDDLVDVGVIYAENMIQALENETSIDVLTGREAPGEDIQILIELGSELDRRASSLGCDLVLLNAEIVADLEGIESENPVVDLFLEIVRSGVVGSGAAP